MIRASRDANGTHLLTASAVLIACSCLAQSSFAQESARVLFATPILQKVGIPQQVCTDQQVEVQGQNSGSGAVLGAIAGGAVLGNELEGRGPDSVQNVRQCTTQTVYQDRVVAFNVDYEYAGKQYAVQSPQGPGPYLQVQIVPILPQAVAPVAVQKRHPPRY